MRPQSICLLKKKPLPRQRGAAIVEFALLLVPMLIVGFGVAEYGRAIYHYNTIAKSVRTAVRVLAQYNPSDAGYGSRVTQAKCLAVYGNNECSGAPLAPGLNVSNVKVCDRVAWGGCAGAVQSDYDNVTTGLGTINLVEVRISDYQFTFIGLPLINIPIGNAMSFGAIQAVMRQTG